MPKIMMLTEEQKARIPEFVQKWTNIGLCTLPADRTRAEVGISALYDLAKLAKPKFVWLPCPISGALSVFCYSMESRRFSKMGRKIIEKAVAATTTHVDKSVCNAIYSEVQAAVDLAHKLCPQSNKSQVARADARFGGSIISAGYAGWADYFNEVCGVKINRSFLDVIESCGYFWVLDGICFASERPSEIHRDNEKRLHNENGMSIRYAGTGWGLYHWHGTQVPDQWITNRLGLKAGVVLAEPNVEIRRAGCEILGWSKILEQLQAVTIDRDSDPEIGVLVQVNLPDINEPVKFLRVRCGTGREFAIGIPPHISTALEAQAWMVGLNPQDFEFPETRT